MKQYVSCLCTILTLKMQEHKWPHYLLLHMSHLSWDHQDPQIQPGHQKPCQKQGWTELHLIHNQDNISLQISEMFCFISDTFNVFLVYSSFVFEIVFIVPQHTLAWKN